MGIDFYKKYDIEYVFDKYIMKKQSNDTVENFLHNLYVAFTRPTELLCVAIRKEVYDKFKKEIDELRKLIIEYKRGKKEKDKLVGIGEIGLDYYWNKENKEIQKYAFIEQIKLANELNLPIAIHTREAVMDTLEILKQNPVNKKGVFHCCPFNRELVKEALKLGFYISIAGPVTFKNSKNAPEIIDMIPIDRMLIETDSPYLAPEPVRGTRNDSRNVKYTAQKIAELKGLTLEEVAEATYRNAEKLYNIEE